MLISADISLGMADILNFFFLVNTRCWVLVYVTDKIQSTDTTLGARGGYRILGWNAGFVQF